MDFGGDLSLQLETEPPRTPICESWAVREDGSLRHGGTGIQIGEYGLQDGKDQFKAEKSENFSNTIEVDQTNILGRGAGGIVAKALHRPTGTRLAVKVVRIEDKAKRQQLINEIENLVKITQSNFLIHLFQCYTHKETGCVHVALEFMDYGSLADLKQKVRCIEDKFLALIMMQILEGLKALHLQVVVHRDVKLGNILINSKGIVKVTDFGISKRLEGQNFCDTFVGTATHMSPERVLGENYSFEADIWSLGLVTYELACGEYPYGQIPSFPVLFDNLCNKPEPRLDAEKFSPELCDFVERQLRRIPEARASTIQLQAHEFITKNLRRVSQVDFVRWLETVYRKEDKTQLWTF